MGDQCMKGEDVEVLSAKDVVRVRVPPWEAFDRSLVVEPPPDWIPPKPFADAIWDSEHRMYYPSGWQWNEVQQTYVEPAAVVPEKQVIPQCSAEVSPPEPDYGVGHVLGGL